MHNIIFILFCQLFIIFLIVFVENVHKRFDTDPIIVFIYIVVDSRETCPEQRDTECQKWLTT